MKLHQRVVSITATAAAFVGLTAPSAGAEIHTHIRHSEEGADVIREAWMNHNTDGGWLRAYARVTSQYGARVTIEKVCLQSELAGIICNGIKQDSGSGTVRVLHASPQIQCHHGRKYRSIAHWHSGPPTTGTGVVTSLGWWPCP
jgi:hypothetical protein